MNKHSFGGLTMPLFAARYPDETAGIVLVDPVAPAEWNPPSERDQKLARVGARVCRRAAFLSSGPHKFRCLSPGYRGKGTRESSCAFDQSRHVCTIRKRFESVVLGFAGE
jgi:pimeloyl-ACP methyl ester carboxylesterase